MLLREGPTHRHIHTHTQKRTPIVFIEGLQLEERELETRACTWTCPPHVIFDDQARRDSNLQHDATPSTRDGGKASDARWTRREITRALPSRPDQTRRVDLRHLKPDRCQADQTRRVDLRHLERDRPTLTLFPRPWRFLYCILPAAWGVIGRIAV